ncbi:MAG: TetR/AcrR family transcriptional regulator [Firmicutes bacterium]|nr:TetR/AcrR family transcriptional regulator [Bacillota bacterium]
MEKSEENKKIKQQRLLETAFHLFTEKGVENTSIQEIVDEANVAKGTFYLYFKDKYDIRNVLITSKSQQLFHDALESLHHNYINSFSDQIIFVINYVIDELIKEPLLLKFISKNLSSGIYNNALKIEEGKDSLYQLFIKGIEENHINLTNPEITLFMIIELVSSTCFHTILYKEPIKIEEFKPFLYDTIRDMLK